MFRRVREGLRNVGEADVCLAQWQYIAAAQRTGWEPAVLESLVVEWLYQRPLKYLRFCRRRGLEAFCAFLENRGIQIGVFSDYPVMEKLKSLGVADRMSVALCATDPEINAFKPYPKGFLHACTLWGLRPEEVCMSVIAQRLMPLARSTLACHVSSLPLGHVKRDRVICRARIKRFPRSRGYNVRSCAVTSLRRSMP